MTITLTDEQLEAAETVLGLSRKNPVATLGGYAGCGKTVTASYLFDTHRDWMVCAYTGKAADILRRKEMPAKTIHSTIYDPVESEGKVTFELKHRGELNGRGFLIDEASMVGKDEFDDLKSFGLPIIAIGDHGQLPPVGADAGLMRNPDVKLETIHRNAGPISRFAQHLREGKDARKWLSTPDVDIVSARGITDEQLAQADQIICAFNATRARINNRVRRVVGRKGPAPEVGDRVMCLQNDKTAGVFNGQQGTIKALIPGRNDFLFEPSYGMTTLVNCDPAAWNGGKLEQGRRRIPGRNIPFDFAYCVTAHKFQGDEADSVIVFEEKCDLWEHSRWAYTAASRAKECLLWGVK